MTKFTDDEICRLCGDGIEHHHFCAHDGILCGPCGNPDCHTVTARYTRDPFLGTKWTARCGLCGKTGPTTSDKEDALAWERGHHEEVWQS